MSTTKRSPIWTGPFWVALTERTIASAAGAALAAVGTEAVGIVQLDPAAIGSLAAGAALVSVLKGLAGSAVTGSPSLGGEWLKPSTRARGGEVPQHLYDA